MKYPDKRGMAYAWLLLLYLACAPAAFAGQWNRVSTVLQNDQHRLVKSLSKQERSILRATIALKLHQPEAALNLLAPAKQAKDPLVALLEAEAHRQQAIRAMQQAGDYDKDMARQEKLLASADLNQGLGEADARLHAFTDRLYHADGNPVDILMTGSDITNVFMFDKALNRMFVFQPNKSGGLDKITDEYVVTGTVKGDKQHKGDGRTPHGIYRFVKKLQDKALQSRYGPVAFPIDYPNELDLMHHKTGSGIWLHGYPIDVRRRPPQDTRGCFSLSNDRLMRIAKHVRLRHSWVIVGENLIFGEPAQKQKLLESVLQDIETWRRDWASLDTEAYLSHYHRAFHSGKRNLAAWKTYKRRVNAQKSHVQVSFSDMTLIHDPNEWPEGEVVVAEFKQIYLSSDFADRTHKRLYLARDNASQHWKILLEETIKP